MLRAYVRVLGWTRTSDLQVRNLVLSPLSYEDVLCVPSTRFERATTTTSTPCLYLWTTRAWLPLTGGALQAEDSNPQCPVQSRMCCRVTPACKSPGGVMAHPGGNKV